MTKTSQSSPKLLDHCILPVSSLDEARERYAALGFTVAPDARHPFGTENACVFFEDGTYLEPLAVAQREDCEHTAQKGNVFTARDQAFRFRNGENGFSGVALKTDDADSDHRAFAASGISAGRKLIFGRPMTDAKGNKAQATFKLAFAADLRSPDAFFFSCERINVPAVDRSSLIDHPNGVIGIAEIVASELNPTDFQYFLQVALANRETEASSFGMEIACANANLKVATPEGLAAEFGIRRNDPTRGLRLGGIVFRVRDLNAFTRYLDESSITHTMRGAHCIVPPAPGQGCFFAFKEAS